MNQIYLGCAKFLIKKSVDYIQHMEQLMLQLMLHFPFSHLDRFPDNLGDLSVKQGYSSYGKAIPELFECKYDVWLLLEHSKQDFSF